MRFWKKLKKGEYNNKIKENYMKKAFPLFLFITLLECFAQRYDITYYGALGDSNTLNTSSIQKAVDKCNSNGVGIVYVPSGIFITGTIQLKSNFTLYLENDEVL